MKPKDIIYIAASGIAIAILVAAIILLFIFLFTSGSPLLLTGLIFGLLAGLGIWGIFILAVLAIAFFSFWYIAYAYIKSKVEPKKAEKGGYKLERLKKA